MNKKFTVLLQVIKSRRNILSLQGERSTVLLLANGKQYTQRWNYTETSNTVKVHASRQLEDRHRRQAFAGDQVTA